MNGDFSYKAKRPTSPIVYGHNGINHNTTATTNGQIILIEIASIKPFIVIYWCGPRPHKVRHHIHTITVVAFY